MTAARTSPMPIGEIDPWRMQYFAHVACPAEVLISTAYIRECIENKEKTKYIREQISLGTSQYGMQTFDQSLFQLYKSGLITLDEALKRATNPDEFRLKIQGVQFTADISREEMESSLQMPGESDLMGGAMQFDIEQH